jgi:hypothetical protein
VHGSPSEFGGLREERQKRSQIQTFLPHPHYIKKSPKMSGAQSKSTDKASDSKTTAQNASKETTTANPPAKLEEDDEFEDFPAEGNCSLL